MEADRGRVAAMDTNGQDLTADSGPSAEGYVVFYDLPQGRYELRTLAFPARGARYQVEIPKEERGKRIVTLRPGQAAYLGEYAFDWRPGSLSEAILRGAKIVSRFLMPWKRRPVFIPEVDQRNIEPTMESEVLALKAVKKFLLSSQWRGRVDARLKELSFSVPPKKAGFIFSREIPLKEESFLSWRDTLNWGEPNRRNTGLSWHRPGHSAVLAIYFTSATAPGYYGWDQAVNELRREAIGNVDDFGELYEVKVATRIGTAARSSRYDYERGTLIGSQRKIIVTETILVPDGDGMFVFRLRAPQPEFKSLLASYREFLLQIILGPPIKKVESKSRESSPIFLP